MKNVTIVAAIYALLILCIGQFSVAYAHPGGLEADGCHYCRTNCDKWDVKSDHKHCHRTQNNQKNGGDSSSVTKKPHESIVSQTWCAKHNGKIATLPDGTKPDCILQNEVVEFDWANDMKPYECVGQAQHYAKQTGLKPKCILIRSPNQTDSDFRRAVRTTNTNLVSVECVNWNAENIPCN